MAQIILLVRKNKSSCLGICCALLIKFWFFTANPSILRISWQFNFSPSQLPLILIIFAAAPTNCRFSLNFTTTVNCCLCLVAEDRGLPKPAIKLLHEWRITACGRGDSHRGCRVSWWAHRSPQCSHFDRFAGRSFHRSGQSQIVQGRWTRMPLACRVRSCSC